MSFRPHLPAAEIRYMLDGTEPTRDSRLYQEPIPLPDGGLVAVRAYDAAGESGPVAREAYGTSRQCWTVTRRLPKHLFRWSGKIVVHGYILQNGSPNHREPESLAE